MKQYDNSQSGMALILAIVAIIAIMGAMMVTVQLVSSTKQTTDVASNMQLVEEACKSGIDLAVEQLWNQYRISNGNTTGNLASYRVFIDDIVADGAMVNLLGDDPVILDSVADVRVESVEVQRRDDANGILLTVQATGAQRVGDTVARQRVEQTMRVGGQPFSGFEYAVLSNYINCVLCHAGFYSLDQQLNTNPDLYNSFDRVKVATLEALLYRPSSADSKVAGTIYTRGNVYDEVYRPQTPAQIASSAGLKGLDFSTEDGKLFQNEDGSLVGPVNLRAASTDAQGQPEQFASLYTNYPTDPNLMTDGHLPTDFPAPFPDNNENRLVDDAEFEEIADYLEGSITGGVAYGVPQGDIYTGNALPAAGNDALADLSSGRYDGNLILVGTEANPIVIDGEVAVNGDLVLRGKVKGTGQMFVRGNTYIAGDVTYADAPGHFGVAEDGTQNALGLVTGGSVLMGDYLTIRGKNHSEDDRLNVQYPDSGLSIDVRSATKSKTETKNGITEVIKYGYFDPGAIDAGGIQNTLPDGTRRQGQQFSFTQSELQLFNNLELKKALADPDYKPRFYGLRDSQPDNIYVWTRETSEEHAVRYNRNGVKTLQARLIELGVNVNSVLDRATFHYMNPSDNWISEDTLRNIWWNDEMSRTASHSTWKFDGLLYSNNAIFAITRSKVRHKSNTEGKMQVRGAIICPDLGVLVAGPDQRGVESFTMMYDPRVRGFWTPADRNVVVFERLVYRTVPLS